uniref:Uncharacterized protein n=1 Tax=Anguilla anguilla TaxID=7936 RepID=A0A0E9QWR8_ANGAN
MYNCLRVCLFLFLFYENNAICTGWYKIFYFNLLFRF